MSIHNFNISCCKILIFMWVSSSTICNFVSKWTVQFTTNSTHLSFWHLVAMVTRAGAWEAVVVVDPRSVEGSIRCACDAGEGVSVDAVSLEDDVVNVATDDLLVFQQLSRYRLHSAHHSRHTQQDGLEATTTIVLVTNYKHLRQRMSKMHNQKSDKCYGYLKRIGSMFVCLHFRPFYFVC